METEVVYAGKTVNLLEKISEVIRDFTDKGLHQAILLPSTKTGKEICQDIPQRFVMQLKCLTLPHRFHCSSINLSAFLDAGDDRELIFAQLPFDHPVFILYTSGTTGKPKCIVHSAGVGNLFLLLWIMLLI